MIPLKYSVSFLKLFLIIFEVVFISSVASINFSSQYFFSVVRISVFNLFLYALYLSVLASDEFII